VKIEIRYGIKKITGVASMPKKNYLKLDKTAEKPRDSKEVVMHWYFIHDYNA